MDALRNLVVTERCEGLVYIYDMVYVSQFDATMTEDRLARMVHRASGYIPPDGRDDASPELYTAGPEGVQFKVTIADRARPGLIRQFSAWEIRCMPHTKPDEKNTRFGEIEDGITLVRVLAQGHSNFRAVYRDEYQELLRRAREKLFPANGRTRFLTDKEKEAWQKYLAELDVETQMEPSFAGAEFEKFVA